MKLLEQGYHLTGQLSISLSFLKNTVRKNFTERTTDISNNSQTPDNHKRLWSYIKSKRQDNFGIPILKDSNGTYNTLVSTAFKYLFFDSVY